MLTLALLLATATAADPRVLVLDVTGTASLAPPATKLVTSALQRANRFQVVGGDELRRVLTYAADVAEAGCDTTSCLAEIAGALDAQLVVFGEVTQLGDGAMLTLNLFDTAAVTSIARATGDVDSASLPEVSARLVRQLVREYDASRGAWPAGTVPIVAGVATTLAGSALVVIGGLQLAALAEDEARHDRLVDDFADSGDKSLIDDAEDVRKEADAHALSGSLALGAGALVVAGGVAAIGWGAWMAVE